MAPGIEDRQHIFLLLLLFLQGHFQLCWEGAEVQPVLLPLWDAAGFKLCPLLFTFTWSCWANKNLIREWGESPHNFRSLLNVSFLFCEKQYRKIRTVKYKIFILHGRSWCLTLSLYYKSVWSNLATALTATLWVKSWLNITFERWNIFFVNVSNAFEHLT